MARGALIATLLGLAACARHPERAPNVLLVSIDTLRSDRLGCYGYSRDTSPALDRFASTRAVRFANAVAESPWTLPSHVTMLSGLHPLTHGVRRPNRAVGEDVPLLAERLSRAGWYAFGLTDGGWMSENWGFSRGFESFSAQDRDFSRAVEEALEFVRHREPRGPWFAFLHTYDVHCPYDPPAPYAGRFASADAEAIEVAGRCGNPHFNSMELNAGQRRFLSDRYDEDVRRTDDALATLFAALDAGNLWNDTIVIVVSDHGEEFGEHGQIGHERSVHREVLEIPFLVAVPGVAPTVIEDPVGLADLVPTVLELCGLPATAGLDGRSLAPRLRGATAEAPPGVTGLSDLGWQADLGSLLRPGEHLVVDRKAGEARYFDLRVDPDEQDEHTSASPERLAALLEELRSAEEALRRGARTPATLEHETRTDELRKLGY